MASCANCGTAILFGGVRHESLTFCSQGCFDQAVLLREALSIPDESILPLVREVHQGECPLCGGPGPVDIHSSYRVTSFLVVTQYRTIPQISCQSCGRSARIKGGLWTFILGWWGIPFGIIMTPFYLFKNMTSPTSPHEPSQALKEHIKLVAAHNAVVSLQQEEHQPRG